MRIWHPRSSGPAPAIILFQGASPAGENHEILNRLARGLAKVGFKVYIPGLPRLKEVLIREETVEQMVEIFLQVHQRPDVLSDRITTIGFSFGGSQLVKACLDPRMNGLPAKVLSFGSYFDLERTLKFVLTGECSHAGKDYSFDPHEWGNIVFFHNYIDYFDGDFNIEEIRRYFLALVEEDGVMEDHLAALSEKDRSFIDLISTDRKKSLELALSVLPNLRSTVESLSPRYFTEKINFSLHLVHGARDNMIPFTETMAFSDTLEKQGTEVHTFISGLYSHNEAESAERSLFGRINELWRLGSFINDFIFR
jgi:dienelactone hydrolase